MAGVNRFWPLSIIAIGLILAGWLVLLPSPYATKAQPSCDERPAYPGCIEEIYCGAYPDSICNITKTAVVLTRTAAAAPVLTQTAQVRGQQPLSPTATQTATVARLDSNSPTATSTATATLTNTPLVVTRAVPSPIATLVPTATPMPTLTPTPTIPAMLRCAPGDLLELNGTARPQTALLALFDDRTVGGGASDRSGTFRIVLRIGDERPGIHEITVRERETTRVVATYTCETPPPPTPTPTFGPLPATLPLSS